ncbi:hypothetical protein LCGC14_2990220, partial [marine sediment metagenome]
RRIIKQGSGGRIIALSSIHAVLSEPNCSHYTAAKGGIEAFCRTLATELAPHKITVNFIRPGATYTELTIPMYTEAVKKALFERVPLKEIVDDRMRIKPDSDPDTVEREDWGKLGTRLRKIIRTFRDLDVNMIVTALAREYEDDEAPSRTTLALAGQMRAELPAFLDVVCYMQVESRRVKGKRKQRRVLRPQPTARYVAKDRSWVLGDVVVNPTMDKIVTKIYRERGLLDGMEESDG